MEIAAENDGLEKVYKIEITKTSTEEFIVKIPFEAVNNVDEAITVAKVVISNPDTSDSVLLSKTENQAVSWSVE